MDKPYFPWTVPVAVRSISEGDFLRQYSLHSVSVNPYPPPPSYNSMPYEVNQYTHPSPPEFDGLYFHALMTETAAKDDAYTVISSQVPVTSFLPAGMPSLPENDLRRLLYGGFRSRRGGLVPRRCHDNRE